MQVVQSFQARQISGAARGIDQAAMHGALRNWGTATGILSSFLEKEAVNREHREVLMEGNLVLVSPYDPKAGFNVGNAMRRNKLIYALADAGLVIDSSNGEGGTWAGAVEQLEKLRFVPIFARSKGQISAGLNALRRKGALAWPDPDTPDELNSLLTAEAKTSSVQRPRQVPLIPPSGDGDEKDESQATDHLMPPEDRRILEERSPADDLFAIVETLLDLLDRPITEADVTAHLCIERKQARVWLNRLVIEGKYKKLSRPVRYVKLLPQD